MINKCLYQYTATRLAPLFGASQDGISEAGTCMEVILIRYKIKGVMRVIPVKIDQILWTNKYNGCDGSSRITALSNALGSVLSLSYNHIAKHFMGCNWDGKYFKMNCAEILTRRYALKPIQFNLWDFNHLLELAHDDLRLKCSIPWYQNRLDSVAKFKTRFNWGKSQQLLKIEHDKNHSKFKTLIRYVTTRFIAYLYRSMDRFIYNYKFMYYLLNKSDDEEDRNLVQFMSQLGNVCDILIITEMLKF